MDPYAPCPCGSGKKVKFCCQAILPEMAKIERLQENNQPRMALQLIEKLLADHEDNGWLQTQRALALLNDQRPADARDGLLPYLRKEPDHPMANALLALAISEIEPYPAFKKVVHRAFLKSSGSEPRLTAMLAGRLAAAMVDAGQEMAARQHMALVLRWGGEEDRQRTLMAMLELDSDTDIPFPLRGPHPLPPYEAPEALQPTIRKVHRLASIGCFSEAADILGKSSEEDAESAELFHTIGLLYAWDGNVEAASEALHKAAKLYADFDTAVEVETVAQLLDRRSQGESIPSRVRRYRSESLSRLLTRMDNEDRLARLPKMENSDQPEAEGPAATYVVLDRPQPPESELNELTLETVPQTLGRITLFDRVEGEGDAVVYVTAIEGERLDTVVSLFEATAGDLATYEPPEEADGEDADIVARYSKDELELASMAFFPPKTPGSLRQRLYQEFVQRSIDQTWMNRAQAALGGKSPQEVIGDDNLKVALAAAVYVFDAFLDRRDYMLDRAQLCERLQLPTPQPMQDEDGKLDLNTLPVIHVQRIDLRALSDENFDRILQRSLVLKHCHHTYQVLIEFLEHRPELVAERPADAQQAYLTLADICRGSLRDEEAMTWLQRGFEFLKSQRGSFETEMMWKLRELTFRLRDASDPGLKDLLLEIWNHYGAKLPALRERLQILVASAGIDPPWDSAIVMPQAVGTNEGAVWTAEQSGSTDEGESKKLWLPD